MLCFFTAKGGAGCSVTAAAVALLLADHHPTLLVDLTGDQPEILGLPPGTQQPDAVSCWAETPHPAPDALRWLEQTVTPQLALLSSSPDPAAMSGDRQMLLAALLRSDERRVVVDVGDHPHLETMVTHADRSVLVTRPCYVALSRARRRPTPDDIVVVTEPHRALTTADIEAVLGAPVTVVVSHEPQIFRAVDAGLLVRRLPRSLRRLDVFG